MQVFGCKCQEQKKYRLTIDGGSFGNYQLELCQFCYSKEHQKFLISIEELKP